MAENDNWQEGSQKGAIEATGLAPTHPAESGILAVLPPGPATALVRGKNGTTGIGLVEIYLVPNGSVP